MPPKLIHTRSAASAALLVLTFAATLAACGSSSKSPTTTTTVGAASTSAGTSTSGSGTTTPGSGTSTSGAPAAAATRFNALRECLRKQGITLPAHKPGTSQPFQLPQGASRTQYLAALRKCVVGLPGRRGGFGREILRKSPAYRAALAKFAECMRANGVNLPAPNTSGTGPVFNTSGLDTSSAKFKAATAKCRAPLERALPFKPGASGSKPPNFG